MNEFLTPTPERGVTNTLHRFARRAGAFVLGMAVGCVGGRLDRHVRYRQEGNPDPEGEANYGVTGVDPLTFHVSHEHLRVLGTMRERFIAVFAWPDSLDEEQALAVWGTEPDEAVLSKDAFEAQLKGLMQLLETQDVSYHPFSRQDIDRSRQIGFETDGDGRQTEMILVERIGSVRTDGQLGATNTAALELYMQQRYNLNSKQNRSGQFIEPSGGAIFVRAVRKEASLVV